MSAENGIVRIGRKGKKQFAFGDDPPFTIDVVVAFQEYIGIDDNFRTEPKEDGDGRRIPTVEMPAFHAAVQQWAIGLATPPNAEKPADVTVAEALDFAARLREVWNELQDFFVPKSSKEPESPGTSAAALTFSEDSQEA